LAINITLDRLFTLSFNASGGFFPVITISISEGIVL
jgi:hypothetical protein